MLINLKKSISALIASGMLAGAITGCGAGADSVDEKGETSVEEMNFEADMSEVATGSLEAGSSVHDPSVIADNGRYYIVGSHMTFAYSDDLRKWTLRGNGYTSTNMIFGDLYKDETGEVFRYTGKKDSVVPTDDGKCHLWAPDIIYNKEKGLYYMYYCTSSTWNASTLGFATSETIDGKYEYGGDLIYSGLTRYNLEETNVLDYVDKDYALKNYVKLDGTYNFNEYPNALDPAVFYDKDGKMWMVYGSWSGGIFLLQIDESTGEVIHPEADPDNNVDAYYGKKLMGGGHKSIEGPYILYDPDSDYYYLFVSYGGLVSDGGYQIRVFRSKDVYGEYLDMNGEKPDFYNNDHSGFGLKISGNHMLPSLQTAYKATGHNSAMIDADGRKFIVYHTRFENRGEYFEPRVRQYFLNKEGWPVVLPYITDGETISESGYPQEEVAGRYYLEELGLDISGEVRMPAVIYLDENGTVYSQAADGSVIEGSYTLAQDSYYMTITIDGIEYSGVFCRQKDEAGNEVLVFTACGQNRTVYGVKCVDRD
jgi:arabinan endo-1,5-alpha-L-arabinosidase